MSIKRLAAAAVICATLFGAGNAAAVTGDSIYGTWNATPISGDYWPFGTKTVGPGIEFAPEYLPTTIDFSEYTVTISVSGYIGYSNFDFNGYIFKDLTTAFSGRQYFLDTAATTSNFTASRFSQSGDTMSFNFSGLSLTPGVIVVRAVPEPETYAMLVGGLGLLGYMSRRRKQHSARA